MGVFIEYGFPSWVDTQNHGLWGDRAGLYIIACSLLEKAGLAPPARRDLAPESPLPLERGDGEGRRCLVYIGPGLIRALEI
jgi:hypothetical protein